MSRENPFLALRSYTRADAGRFFGRDADLVILKSRLLSGRSTLLFAASGAGKTSFLNARLHPAVEADWLVIPHSDWAAEPPLTAVRAKTRQALAAAGFGTVSGERSIPEMLQSSKEGSAKGPRRFLFMLDQFEELFQHWRDVPAIDAFAGEIARVTEMPQVDARVLFSMREEFLGELSLFDLLIPDLFGNSYRLKNPSRDQCEDIIEHTAGKTSESGLQGLLDDLIGCGLAASAQPGISSVRNRIALPFLQIACYRIWDEDLTAAPEGAEFLGGYEKGRAERELRSYCTETLERLLTSDEERDLASDAFGYLMTRRGAKMAYELDNLADHMKRPKDELKLVLEKLSQPDVRILREFQGGSSDSQWFELYHDLYASFLFDWKAKHDEGRRTKEKKREYQRLKAEIEEETRKAARRNRWSKVLGYAIAVLLALAFIGRGLYVDFRNVRNWVDEGGGSYENAVASTALLEKIPFVKDRIQAMWAGHWKDEAEKSALTEDRDTAIVYGLMAASRQSDPLLLRELAAWTSGPMQQIVRTARLPSRVSLVDVAADGETVLAFAGGRAYQWRRAADGKLVESALLSFRDASSGVEQSASAPDTSEPAAETITGLAFSPDGSLVLAYGRNRFGMFSTKSGQTIWTSDLGGPSRPPLAAFSPDGLWTGIATTPGNPTRLSVQLCMAASSPANCGPITVEARSRPTFSPDSKELAIVEPGDGISFWSVATRKATTKLIARAFSVVYLSPDKVAVRRTGSLAPSQRGSYVEIFQRREGEWVSETSFPRTTGLLYYLPQRNAFGVVDSLATSVELIDISGNSVAKAELNRGLSFPHFTAGGNFVAATGAVLTEWSLRNEVASTGVRIPDGEDLEDINGAATAFVTSNNTGTYLRQVHDPGTTVKLTDGPAPGQVAFSPSGRYLFALRNRQVAFFTLNPFMDTGKRYTFGSRSTRFAWASDNLVQIGNGGYLGDRELVDAGSGTSRYNCDPCGDLLLTPQQDLIEMKDDSIWFKRKHGDGWEAGGALKSSSDIESMSLRGGVLVGIHANQFRIWDLAKPNQEPQIVKTSDKLKLAEAGLFSGYYVTISETGEINLWPVKNPKGYSFSAKIASFDEMFALAQGEGAVVVGNDWVHVLTQSTTGKFEFASRPMNGDVESRNLRATRDGIRMAVRRGSATMITPLLKPDLSDLAPLAPPAGKTWTDVLNTWTQRLDLKVNSDGKVSGTTTEN
jgi:hypothetical protein